MLFERLNAKKTSIIFLTIVMVLWAASRVYIAIINYQQRPTQDAVAKKVDDELSKYPMEVQNLKITKLCQEMQTPILIEQGIQKEQIDIVSLPVCACISASLMKLPVFSNIQSMADSGSDFFEIASAHKGIFTNAMSSCGK